MRRTQLFAYTLCSLLSFNLLPLSLPSWADESTQQPVVKAPDYVTSNGIIKSPIDPREYLALTLDNGLEVLLISDPQADKAAASLDVSVGSGDDPRDRQGLAHFLEHMLFLGTEKYPEADAYQHFISAHGGSHNAFTSFDHTNYFFDIDPTYFPQALDRFAQFFIGPLFNSQYVDREMNAVHSEYQSKLKDDGRRSFAVLKQLINPEHPLSKFAVGSLDTLANRPGDPVREDLLRFYQQHYAASKMSLVLLGPESISELKALAQRLFSAIPAQPTQAAQDRETATALDATTPPLMTPGTLPALVQIDSVQDRPQLSLQFPVPPIKEYALEKPLHYLSALIGHEGDGSLLQQLKAEDLAQSLSAGPNLDHEDAASLAISIGLTEKGLDQYQRVIDLSFQYLRMLKTEGVKAWFYEQEKLINDTEFRFQDTINPSYYAVRLAGNLKHYPLAETIRGDYLYRQFDPALINSYLQRLNPDNVLITLTSPGLPTDRQDPWYGAGYSVEPIAQTQRRQWADGAVNANLHWPEPNPFLATDLTLKSGVTTAVPAVIEQRPGYRLWHKMDQSFEQPKVDFYFTFRSPAANDSPLHYVQTKLFVELVKDQLNSFIYPAQVAGFDVNLYNHLRGFSLRLSGFRDKQQLLLQRITQTLNTLQVDADKLALYQQKLRRALENSRRQKPYNQTLDEVYQRLLQPQWSVEQQLAALPQVTAENMQAFSAKLLARGDVEALAHGNLSTNDAQALSQVLERELLNNVKPVDVSQPTVKELGAGSRVIDLDIDHNDSAITFYSQSAEATIAQRARFGVLAEILSPLFYNRLRTQQQLGYVVFATPMPILEHAGLAFVVQSPVAGAALLQQHIQQFIAYGVDTVRALDEATLERYKQSLLVKLMRKDQTMQDRSNRYWQEIDRGHTEFDSRERLAEEIAAVDKEALLAAYPGLHKHQLIIRAEGEQPQQPVAAQVADES